MVEDIKFSSAAHKDPTDFNKGRVEVTLSATINGSPWQAIASRGTGIYGVDLDAAAADAIAALVERIDEDR